MKELMIDLGERSYPIYIGEGLLDAIAEKFDKHAIRKASPVMIVTDEYVSEQYLRPVQRCLEEGGYQVVPMIVPAGESSKSLAMLEQIVTKALEAGLDRNSTIVALGGGVVGDLAGFAAASYMRGVRFIQVPTTILAHDSSVGGKVAVNHKLAKNVIGAFHQPEFVLYDTATLQSLPEREVRAGLAEVIKHGLIWDAEFVDWCSEYSEQMLALDQEALSYALYRGCQVKAAVVSQDERENGLRAILNLGHTIGHALEAVAGYRELLHGEAISIGMMGAAKLAVKLGHPESIYYETKRILQKFRLPTKLPMHLDTDKIMSSLKHDKKFRDGKLVFVIPTAIGRVELNDQISVEWVRETVERLKQED